MPYLLNEKIAQIFNKSQRVNYIPIQERERIADEIKKSIDRHELQLLNDNLENLFKVISCLIDFLAQKEQKKLLVPIEECEISIRAVNRLKRAGYETLFSVAMASDADLLRMSNFGKISLREVREEIERVRRS